MSMHTYDIHSIKDFIYHVAIRNNVPVMIWGQPGVGKTEGVAQVCEEHDLVLWDIRLSQYDSVDLRGFPGVAKDGTTVWHVPSTLPFVGNPRADKKKRHVVMLDEINAATSEATLAVAYQLVNEGRVGEHVLLPGTVILAAGNREGDKGVTRRMPLPLANRFDHAECAVSAKAWCIYMAEKGYPDEVIAFYSWKPTLLSTFDPSKPDKAFATPRSTKRMIDLWMDTTMPQHIKIGAMAGCVGSGPATEFLAFLDIYANRIRIEDILADPDGARLPGEHEMALRYSTAIDVSGHMSRKTTDKLYRYLVRLGDEYTIVAWDLAERRDPTIRETKAFLDYAQRFRNRVAKVA